MLRLLQRATTRALVFLSVLAPVGAMAQFGVPSPITPAPPCPAFTGFPLSLNLGTASLSGNDGITNRCAFQTTQSALNVLVGQVSSLAPLSSPTFTGTATMPKLTITGSGSTGDVSVMSLKPTGGSTARTLADRAADLPVGQDFGVTTGSSDQSSPLATALSTATSIALPRGSYALTNPLTLPPSSVLTMRPGAAFAFSGAGTLFLGSGAIYTDSAYGATKDEDVAVRAFGAARSSGGQDPFALDQYATSSFLRATASDAAALGTGFGANLHAVHNFGGSTASGGRAASYSILNQTAATSASNPNRNYIGNSGIMITRSGDGGTDLANGVKGAYFGMHGYCQNYSGQNLLECAGVEFNTYMAAGTSAQIVAGVTSVGNNRVQGSAVDAAYDVGGGTEFSGSHIGWKHGINFNNSHGADPTNANSVLIGSTWLNLTTRTVDPTQYRTVLAGLDLRGFATTQAGVLGQARPGSGNFLEYLNSAGTADLFVVNSAGQTQTTGILGRTGTTGGFGANYYNFNWNGTGLDAFVDAIGVGTIETRVAPPSSSSSPCSVGVNAYDTNYEYRCVATNTWKRAALTSW